MTRLAALPVAAAALILAAAPIDAQRPLSLDVDAGAPRLAVGPILADDALEDAVRSGLPLRMQFRLELWRDAFFDELVDQSSWTLVVAFEPLEQVFLAGTLRDTALTRADDWASARQVVERIFRPALRPGPDGRFYYIGYLEIETLSLSDLEELEHWLRGELEPAVRGGGSVGGALGTGLRRLFIRVLGLPARRYEVRSDRFRVP